jgi:hypothetical protein
LARDAASPFDFQFTAAVFGWNDPAGTMLADHGFALHDRQTTLFGRAGSVQTDPTKPKKELFHEIDDRPGYYVGVQARYLDRAVLNVLHYDNRGDPQAQSPELRDMAWKTRFDAVALRIETGREWTLLLQAIQGATPPSIRSSCCLWDFDSQSAMVAKRWGRHMLAARYDAFEIEFQQHPTGPAARTVMPGRARGHSNATITGASPLEWLRVESDVPARRAELGEAPFAPETKIELLGPLHACTAISEPGRFIAPALHRHSGAPAYTAVSQHASRP